MPEHYATTAATHPLLIHGDACHLPLADQSVHCVVTSPPYFNLRRYSGVEPSQWPAGSYVPVPGVEPMTIDAWKGTLGNEPIPSMYVWHCLLWLRECWRVMRNDAVLWLICGDSYSAGIPGYPAGSLIGIPSLIMQAALADSFKEDDPDEEYFAFPGGKIGAAWLAALVDGEGTIGINESRHEHWNSNYTTYLSIGMTDRNVLEHAEKVVGLGTIRVKAEPGATDGRGIVNRRRYYNYRIEAQKAASVIRYIYPYLIAKKKQAIIAHNLAILARTSRVGRVGQKVPQELMEKRAWCFHAIKRLNQRQDLDMPSWLLDMPCVVEKPRWIVRNDVVWAKAACMPESVAGWRFQQARCNCFQRIHPLYPAQQALVESGMWGDPSTSGLHQSGHTDPRAADPACPECGGTGHLAEEVLRQGSWRHTRSHETILMLTKQMSYFSNSEAVREANSDDMQRRAQAGHTRGANGKLDASRQDHTTLRGEHAMAIEAAGRNPRSVIQPRSSGLNLAHYASYPASLIEPLVKATCPERVCPQCGQGWCPVITSTGTGRVYERGACPADHRSLGQPQRSGSGSGALSSQTTVHGLRPTCPHYCTCATAPCTCGQLPLTAYLPGLVLDPFCGSGTTMEVARALNRRSIGVDCSLHYLQEIARERLGLAALDAWQHGEAPKRETYHDLPLFQEVPHAPA